MDNTLVRLALIVELIELTQHDVLSCDEKGFHADRRLTDATALRVMHIGENAMRLDSAFRAHHSDLPWRDMAATRNFIAHDYSGINHALIRRAVVEDLDDLRLACVAELAAIKNQGE